MPTGYAYVADGEDGGLRVVDVSDPANPTEVGFYDTPGYAYGVAVAGGYAYVADGEDGGLRVVDVSDPTNPAEVGFCDTLENDSARDVAVVGEYAYVVGHRHFLFFDSGWLLVADISNPASPIEAGFYETPEIANGVAVAGGYAFVANGDVGLLVVDVSNPANPTEVGFYDTPGSAQGVAVAEGYAYVADERGGLQVVDVSTPSNPTQVGFYDTPWSAYGVAVTGDYAYVADGYSGLRVVDVSGPSSPTGASFHDTPGSAHGVAVAGGYVYVADGYSGLRVVNVSTPANPTEVGFYDTPGYAYGVAVAGSYAYVVGGTGPYWDHVYWLRVVDISTPYNPTEVGFYDMPGLAYGVAVAGGYAYVTNGHGLRVVDVSTPSNPTEVGSYDTLGHASGVAVAGSYAYVADDEGLCVVDVSTPSNPTEVGACDTPGWAMGVDVAGGYAYVADYDGGLRVVDVSDPTNPTEVGFYDTPGRAYGVAVAGDYIYVADSGGGLFVLRFMGGDLSGVVRDATTNDPLPDVQVTISGRAQETTFTNDSGEYSFTNIPTGLYWIEFSKNGYDRENTWLTFWGDTMSEPLNPLLHPFEPPFYEELAGYYAPVWYQDVDVDDSDFGDADYITNFDFDGNWDGDDNWQSQQDDEHSLNAYIYYSVIKTETHWFILYADFHPRDWGGGSLEGNAACTEDHIPFPESLRKCHENDLEGVLVVAEHDGSTEDYGEFLLMGTVRHLGFEWFSKDDVLFAGDHPQVYVEPKGHGVKAYEGVSVGDGVVYSYEAASAEEPPRPFIPGIHPVSYDLIHVKLDLWRRRHDYISPMDDYRTYKNFYFFEEDEGVHLPEAGARPPWGWYDLGEFKKGDFFWDPAYTVAKKFNLREGFSQNYDYNPYCKTETVISYDQGGSLFSNDGSTEIRMAPGITTASIRVVHTRNCIGGPDIVSSLANAPVKRASSSQLSPTVISDLESIGQNLSLTATFLETGLPVTDLQKPYEMTFRYTDDDVENIFEDSLVLYWWDGDEWVAEPTSVVDEANNTVTATPGHLGIFAVMGTPKTTIYLPLVLRLYVTP